MRAKKNCTWPIRAKKFLLVKFVFFTWPMRAKKIVLGPLGLLKKINLEFLKLAHIRWPIRVFFFFFKKKKYLAHEGQIFFTYKVKILLALMGQVKKN